MISEIVESVEQCMARKNNKESFKECEAANPFPKFFESISFFDDEGHYHLVNDKQFRRLQQLFDEWYGYKAPPNSKKEEPSKDQPGHNNWKLVRAPTIRRIIN